MIIRPVGLAGDENDRTLTEYKIDQGEKLYGRISRFTLAELTLEAMKSSEIPSKVTFECKRKKWGDDSSIGFKDLKGDTKESVLLEVPHRHAKNTFWRVLFFVLILVTIVKVLF